jgi:hypothetical protein
MSIQIDAEVIRKEAVRTDSTAHTGKITRVRADADFVYSVDASGMLAVWSKKDLALLHKQCVPEAPFHSLGVDDKYVFAGSTYLDSVIRVWSKKDWTLITTLDDKSGAVLDLCLSGNTLYSCCSNGLIHSWSIDDLSLIGSVATGQNILQAIAVDNRCIYVGGIDNKIDAFLREDLTRLTELVGHDADLFSLMVDDDHLYSGSGEVWWGGPGSPRPSVFETSVRIWKKESWACTDILEGHTDNINALAKHNNHVYSVSDDATLRIFSLSKAESRVLNLARGPISDMIIDSQSVFLACNDNSIWKVSHSVLDAATTW